MSSFGLDKNYFLELQFLNERYSASFIILYSITFIIFGGWIPFLFATIGGLLITLLIQRFIINQHQPIPIGSGLIITGCSSGIGKQAALHFAEEGLIVFATVRNESDSKILLASINTTQNGTTQKGGKIIPILMDVTNQEQINKAVNTIKLYIENNNIVLAGLINNAGYSQGTFLELVTQEQLTKQYDTNVFGLIHVTNAFVPLLRQYTLITKFPKLQPKVIMVSSALTKFTLPSHGLYSSSKYAVEAITDGYRQELYGLGIDVVSVQPGSIKTQFKANIKRDILDNAAQTDPTLQYYADGQSYLLEQEIQSSSFSADPEVVIDIFQEVLISPRPLTRYSCGYDSHFVGIFFYHIWGTLLSNFPIFKSYSKHYMNNTNNNTTTTKASVTTTPTTIKPEIKQQQPEVKQQQQQVPAAPQGSQENGEQLLRQEINNNNNNNNNQEQKEQQLIQQEEPIQKPVDEPIQPTIVLPTSLPPQTQQEQQPEEEQKKQDEQPISETTPLEPTIVSNTNLNRPPPPRTRSISQQRQLDDDKQSNNIGKQFNDKSHLPPPPPRSSISSSIPQTTSPTISSSSSPQPTRLPPPPRSSQPQQPQQQEQSPPPPPPTITSPPPIAPEAPQKPKVFVPQPFLGEY